MKIGIIGTGMVADAIGSALIAKGNEVKMGSRIANNEKAAAWVSKNGANASQGTFAEAAGYSGIVFNLTKGKYSLDALKMAGGKNIN